MVKGMLQVYTGDGKGKTTAAIGLAVRAVGAGKSVFMAQFVKNMKYSEIKTLETIDGIEVKQYGRDCFIKREPEQADIEAAERGLKELEEVLINGQYDLVILDEANIATYFGLFTVNQLLDLVEKRKESVEVVVTGRRAEQALIDKADLVTEMKEIKHYYQQGIEARDGIER